jgi:predicted DNA-binding WGR domain protein
MSTKTIVYPLDSNYKKGGKVFQHLDEAYTCTLNQTSIEDNKNKFYIMQLIQKDTNIIHFIRYGRIGEIGKLSEDIHTENKSAIVAFEKQFKLKTGNNWKDRKNFIKKEGKYFLTETIYEVEKSAIMEIKQTASKLDTRVQQLIKFISDVETMNKSLIELNIDIKKMPLGKLGKIQLDCAQEILKKLSGLIKGDIEVEDPQIMTLSSEYYTYIPYSCGRRKPPLINSKEKLGDYTALLDDLRQIEVAVKINDTIQNSSDHPFDTVYKGLNTTINPLDKTSDMWNYIETYIKNTHAVTHHFKVSLIDIFQISRAGESIKYEQCVKNIDNKQLLWHGSRMCNFCSILQKGLLINPAALGIYITGAMFGGASVYLANAFSKSANYCASDTSNNYACLLLCETALGNQSKRTKADYYITKQSLEKEGCQSTWGMGNSTPGSHIVVDGIKIPNGKLTNSGAKSVLLYDEFIVYDQHQLNIKYMVIVKLD